MSSSDIPIFHVDDADPALVKGDPGDAFQRFVLELCLSDRPQLRGYQGAGKDGGIDLSEPCDGSLKVVECKYIGSANVKEAEKRWEKTADNLRRNLAEPGGPPTGQSQYGPWYETNPAIVEYLFVVNQKLKNEAQRNDLCNKIRAEFQTLAALPHLRHLVELHVAVIDGNDLQTKLRLNEHVLFRWFPRTHAPSGLASLDAGIRRGFLVYLYDEKLPHYRLSYHIEKFPPPAGVEIEDEHSLFDRLVRNECVGLILSGSGGVGKTRLTLELGRLAREHSWVVFKVADTFDLDEVTRRIRPEEPTLFVFDYLETQGGQSVLLERIIGRNRDEGRRMHFVASCRSSYLRSVRQLVDVRIVDISPRPGSPPESWWHGYRNAAVHSILEQGNLDPTDEVLGACRGIPVLAVFLCYLKENHRDADLRELLHEQNFGRWVSKRVQMSFGKVEIDRDLAVLMSLFKMPAHCVGRLEPDTEAPVFNNLAQDGWVEQRGTIEQTVDGETSAIARGTWEVLHDVLADQILTQYFLDNQFTAYAEAARMLGRAGELGLTRSCLDSLQRVREEPVLCDQPWERLLHEELRTHPDAWQAARDAVIRTSLFDEPAQLRILGAHPKIWDGAESDLDMHYALGHLARWAKSGDDEVDKSVRETLEAWIEKAAPYAEESNFVLTYGLQLAPNRFRFVAIDWIKQHPLELQTHYLLVAWLRSGLNKAEVEGFVSKWLEQFSTHPKATFVYKSWLNATQDRALVEDGIRSWLGPHATALDAQFVYKSWLDATQDRALVEDGIRSWLGPHATALEAGFVYRSWLDATQDRALVEDGIRSWLSQHATALDAGFVYQSWLDATQDRALVEDEIRSWLGQHTTALEARFVYRSWLDATQDLALVENEIARWLDEHGDHFEADYVMRAWLTAGGPFEAIQATALHWLHLYRECEEAVFIIKEIAKQRGIPIESIRDILIWCGSFPGNPDCMWRLTGLGSSILDPRLEADLWAASEPAINGCLNGQTQPDPTTRLQLGVLFSYLISLARRNADYQDGVNRLLVNWLRHPAAYGNDLQSVIVTQRTAYVQHVADLIITGELDLDADRQSLERFLKWVNTWEASRKPALHRLITFLRYNYPADELWDLIEFPP